MSRSSPKSLKSFTVHKVAKKLTLVGYLRAPNYLQDLTRDRAADGGNWNDRIDQIAVC